MGTVPVDQITTDGRHRTDLGNIAELADSISEVGLLHPVVVTPDLRLVAGERRLAAVRHLRWTDVPVTVVTNLSDAYDLLRAESDENTCRKPFTPSEAESIATAREAMLRPLAKPGPKTGDAAKFAPSGETRRAAATGTGYSHETIRKVREVKETIESEATPEPVREVAKQALAEMDTTGRVDGSYRRLKAAERELSPSPDVAAFVDDAQSVQDAKYVHAFTKAVARGDDFLLFDADRLASLLDDTEVDLLGRFVSSATRFHEQIQRARRGLRLVKG